MRVAVPIWEDRIAPVLDTADSLVVFEVDRGKILGKRDVYIGLGSLREKAAVIASHADTLVCGALSHDMEMCCAATGLTVDAWLMGSPEMVVLTIVGGGVPGPANIMPGIGGQWRTRREP